VRVSRATPPKEHAMMTQVSLLVRWLSTFVATAAVLVSLPGRDLTSPGATSNPPYSSVPAQLPSKVAPLSVAPLSVPASDYVFDFNNLPDDIYPLQSEPPFRYRPYWDACPDFDAGAWGSEDIRVVPRAPGDKALAITATFDLSNSFNSQKGCIGVAMFPNADINNKQNRKIRAEIRFDPPVAQNILAAVFTYDRQDSRPDHMWYKRIDVPVGDTNWSELVFDLDDLTQRSPSTPETSYVQGPILPGKHLKNILFVNIQFFANQPYSGTIYLDNVTIGGPEKKAFENCNQGFVRADGSHFVLNGSPYRFSGANTYYPFYKSHFMIDNLMAIYQAHDLRVLRTWGFSDGIARYAQDSTPGIGDGNEGNAFQPELGVYFEPTFVNFDYVIKSAGEHCVRLIIPLVNHWSDKDVGTGQNSFGGMGQYLEWCDIATYDGSGRITNKTLFYTHPCPRQRYKNYVAHMLNRVNTLTGIRYKDDPTILAWELTNEARCQTEDSCPLLNGTTAYSWTAEMSDYIKSLDSNHMVALGDEGFFNKPGNSDLFYNGAFGIDWERNLDIESIDFGTVHVYPEHWKKDLAWAEAWIKGHIDDANRIGKPVVFEEYGWLNKANRDQVYASWWSLYEGYHGGADGDLVWMIAGRQDDGTWVPDYDGFTLYPCTKTMQLLQQHAARMHSIFGPRRLYLPLTTRPGSGSLVIYDDQLALGWLDCSWDAHFVDYQSTDYPPHSGNYAIGVQLRGWGGLAFGHAAPIAITSFDRLEFWVHGGASGGQQLRVSVNVDWGNHERPAGGISINNPKYISGGTISPGVWKRVSVPLADLQLRPGETAIVKMNIMDNKGTLQPRFYIDDLRFVSAQPLSGLRDS
jgi:hypothetical protein